MISRFYEASVAMVKVETSVGPQPVGVREMFIGSIERAVNSASTISADWGIGVEAGLIQFPSTTGYIETQLAVIVDRECRVTLGLSPSFELESNTVRAMLLGIELEHAVKPGGRTNVGEGLGYVGIATEGMLTRQELTETAVLMALLPRLAGYKGMARVWDIARQVGASLDCPA